MKQPADLHPIVKQIRNLQRPTHGKRWLSWLLFVSLLTICFLLPSYLSLFPETSAKFFEKHPQLLGVVSNAFSQASYKHNETTMSVKPNEALKKFTANTQVWQSERVTKPTYLGVDKVWNPGHPLDQAHQAWAHDCKACHSLPFVQVQDKDCKNCHQNAADHVDQKITTVSALKEASCASCHRDHNGLDGLRRQNEQYMSTNCASCHSDIKKSYAKTETEDVKDFADKHPEFRYTLAESPTSEKLVRTRLSKQGLVEKTGLKFPHDVHLDEDGVKSPDGKVDMNCASCHTLKADGQHFEPVTMKDHCQSCHDLKFEPAVSNREVPHGSVELVLNTLREFYSYVQVNTVPVDEKPLTPIINLVRPGEDEPEVASYIRSNVSSRNQASFSAESLFEKTSCNLCHEVKKLIGQGKTGTPGKDLPQYEIGAITPSHTWLVSSQFNHAQHRLAECSDCHAAKQSKKAEEVLMPSIKACHDCHTGKQAESNKLVSDCGLCHGFHQSAHSLVTTPKEATKLTAAKH